ncbi:MAG: TRAP transporter substrate-binding protein DctP [Minwuiales bacterium]|nr:TRAP transporter substrate-binding protein DctP [Minwuiales bacterium]
MPAVLYGHRKQQPWEALVHKGLLGLAAVLALTAGAAQADVTELRYSTAAPEQTPWGAYLKTTIKVAEEAAEGSLKITPFYSSQLGDEQTALRQTVRGRIDISGQSNVATSLVVPEIALLAAPNLFRDAAESDCVFDNHVQPIFGPMLEDKGLILLSYVEVGYQTIFSTEPLPDAEAAQGLKIRLPPSNSVTLYWREVGAAGVPLGVVDMVPALKTGQVKAIQTSTVYGVAIGLPKLAPYVIYNNAGAHDIGTVLVSKKVWKKLTEKQQQALLKTADYVDELRKAIRGAEQALLGKAEQAGAKVSRPSGAAAESWLTHAAAAQTALVEEIGGDAPKIWQRIQDAKQACAG